MNVKRFFKNLTTLLKALAQEESFNITQPKPVIKQKKTLSKKQILELIAEATKRKTYTKKEPKSEIQWPEGEVTWEQLCAANVTVSKADLVAALGKQMEKSKKALSV